MLTLLITALSFEKRGFIVAQKNGFVKPFFKNICFLCVWDENLSFGQKHIGAKISNFF